MDTMVVVYRDNKNITQVNRVENDINRVKIQLIWDRNSFFCQGAS